MREKGTGTRERGKGYLPGIKKRLLLAREETDKVHRQVAVYREKGKPLRGLGV